MASSTDKIEQTFAMKPCQKLRGETNCAFGVVHLPDVRRIITCSRGASLQLWDLESGAQIGSPWREGGYDDLDVQMIALSPNGKTVASGSSNGTVRLWDIEAKKVVARWTKDGDLDVVSLCWSIDGEHVLAGNLGGVIRMWNIRSGNTTLGPIETGHAELYVATYLHDQTKIATGGEDEDAINIWDATTGEQLSTVKHDSPVLSLASTSDQKKLISGSDDGSIRIFDTATWDQIAILHHENRDGVAALALFQNDCLLASVSGDIRLWDLDTNLPVGTPIQNEVDRAAISADGKLLVTFAWHTNYVWDIHTILKDPGLKSLLSISKVLQGTLKMLRPIKSLPVLNISDGATRRPAELEDVHRPPQGLFDNPRDYIESSTNKNEHTFTIKPCQKLRGKTSRVIGVVHLPDVRRIITSSVDGLLLLWDLESGERIGDAWKDDGDDHLDVERIALSPNGKTVASGSYDGIVRLWDIETKKVPYQKLRGETGGVICVIHLPDVRRIITCSGDDSLMLWDLESGERIGDAWKDDGNDHLDVERIALSPNGKTVASGSYDGTVRLWDVETKKVVARWTGEYRAVSVCWSADGERVLTGYSKGMIRVWNIRSDNTILGPIKTGHKELCVATYFHNKTKIATGGEDENAVTIWDSKTGKLLSTVKHDSPVWSLASTFDQKKLVSGSFNGSIRIFDTATWNQIAILQGHENEVGALALFQNDRLLASVSTDMTVRLWDLDTNLPVGPPIQHEQVNGAAISADGKLLVTRSTDTYKHHVWDIHTMLKDPGLKSLLSISKVSGNILATSSH
ncbi:WD40 repeat-like protein [Rhizopogon vinicolor AM-OR11-026]|uniref:WD40 repeat-like protein n=1 Tax=Rhizopogon vinicolor AM-OR11-026 TaxID=1314800 RepID=A0A1B7N4X9_9AGAM|nr:WD40 repeat-like protein [Rhizopogon vinicolor AM-OR11-026]